MLFCNGSCPITSPSCTTWRGTAYQGPASRSNTLFLVVLIFTLFTDSAVLYFPSRRHNSCRFLVFSLGSAPPLYLILDNCPLFFRVHAPHTPTFVLIIGSTALTHCASTNTTWIFKSIESPPWRTMANTSIAVAPLLPACIAATSARHRIIPHTTIPLLRVSCWTHLL